jgi:hypothetical protein
MESYLSFEPRYHELTSRDGQPVWVPMYNPMRECVSAECSQILAAGGLVETRIEKLPEVVRRAIANTKRRQQRARWAPVLEPLLAVGFVLGTVSMLAHIGWLVGAALLMAYDSVWFNGLDQLEAVAVSTAVGLPTIGVIVGALGRSWWRCATAHDDGAEKNL